MSDAPKDTLAASGIDVTGALVAPFHRPVTNEEMRQYLIKPGSPMPENGEMEIGEDWALSIFSYATPDERFPVWGWVNGPFAIDDRYVGSDLYYAVLTHLPTGLRMANAASPEEAIEIAGLLEPLCDWATADITLGNMQALNVRMVLKRAGFEKIKAVSSDMKVAHIWARSAAG